MAAAGKYILIHIEKTVLKHFSAAAAVSVNQHNGRKEKNLMKKQWKIFAATAIMTVVLALGGITTQAASPKWKKACKAYHKYLKKNESVYTVPEDAAWYSVNSNTERKSTISQFLIADLDKNGVPELIGAHMNGKDNHTIYVFTYKKGKVVKVKAKNKKAVKIDALSYTGFGGNAVGICNKNHMHVDESWGSGHHSSIYKLKKGKLSCYAEWEWNNIEMRTITKINGKEVSESVYNEKVNCMVQKYWVDNNASNRKTYVK